MALLTLVLHPSDQHVVHYITLIKKYFWKIKQLLTNLCDLIKYIMKYNHIWETEITISFKVDMTINEISATFLLECHYQSLLSVCNNF